MGVIVNGMYHLMAGPLMVKQCITNIYNTHSINQLSPITIILTTALQTALNLHDVANGVTWPKIQMSGI